jgi:hypothetical protein
VLDVKRTPLIVITSLVAVAAASVFVFRSADSEAWTTVESVCMDCHNDIDRAGDISFAGLSLDEVGQHAEVFERVVNRLRGRLMPPPGSAQPEQVEIDRLVSAVESRLDAASGPPAGHVRAQRMTRTEFARAVDGLLGVEIDPVEYLPTEIEADGFTNIASALSVSPAFIEQYVNVARTVAHLAVGEPVPKVSANYFPPPAASQQAYTEGFPLGTRGGIKIRHTFPADGEYRLTLKRFFEPLYPNALETQHTMIILVDDEEQWRGTIGGAEDFALVNRGGAPAVAEIMSRFTDIPLEVKAGTHEVIITFIERARASSDEMIGSSGQLSSAGTPRVPGINGGVDLVGPYNATGVARTKSRQLLFVCEPEVEARERECAEQIAAHLAERAFRRPVTDADLDRLMPFYEEGRAGPGGFDEGIEVLVTAVLASPDFLYRTINPPADAEGPVYWLDDYELATRLAFFLWSQGPDDELLARAKAGELSNPDVLKSEALRMLADPRAEVLVTGFALPWLDVDDLDAVQPDQQIFGNEFNEPLREAFAEEIDLFVKSILLGDANVKQLLTADYSYLNERLARHYGIDGVYGPQFRRVELSDENRFGLLGKGAVQLKTSYGDRTSPVLRGAWVLETLMGTPPTPPPPGVETDLTQKEGEQPKTLRARLEQHRANPTCAACHGAIDPYGLSLENFNVIGSWRDIDREADAPIDARAELPGGRVIDGPVELRQALLARPDQFVQAMTQKLLMYALGREVEYFDMPEVRAIVRAAAAEDYRFAAIVEGIVGSDAFRSQAILSDNTDDSVAVALATGSLPSEGE